MSVQVEMTLRMMDPSEMIASKILKFLKPFGIGLPLSDSRGQQLTQEFLIKILVRQYFSQKEKDVDLLTKIGVMALMHVDFEDVDIAWTWTKGQIYTDAWMVLTIDGHKFVSEKVFPARIKSLTVTRLRRLFRNLLLDDVIKVSYRNDPSTSWTFWTWVLSMYSTHIISPPLHSPFTSSQCGIHSYAKNFFL